VHTFNIFVPFILGNMPAGVRQNAEREAPIHITNSNVQIVIKDPYSSQSMANTDDERSSMDSDITYDVEEETSEASPHGASDYISDADYVVPARTHLAGAAHGETPCSTASKESCFGEDTDVRTKEQSELVGRPVPRSAIDSNQVYNKEVSIKQQQCVKSVDIQSVNDDHMLRSFRTSDSETDLKRFLPSSSDLNNYTATQFSATSVHFETHTTRDDNEINNTITNSGEVNDCVTNGRESSCLPVCDPHFNNVEEPASANGATVTSNGGRSCELVSYPHFNGTEESQETELASRNTSISNGDSSFETVSYPRFNDIEGTASPNPELGGLYSMATIPTCLMEYASMAKNEIVPSSLLDNISVQPVQESAQNSSTDRRCSLLTASLNETSEIASDSIAANTSTLKFDKKERVESVVANIDGVAVSADVLNTWQNSRVQYVGVGFGAIALLCFMVYKSRVLT
jgi:hypothetical protein